MEGGTKHRVRILRHLVDLRIFAVNGTAIIDWL
jgi:hypothetical protein